jgi:hypothetical protein
MLESVILDIIRKNAAHASLKAVDASRECPARHSALAISPGSSARCAGSCGGCARGAFLGPRGGEFAAKNKQSRYCEDDY